MRHLDKRRAAEHPQTVCEAFVEWHRAEDSVDAHGDELFSLHAQTCEHCGERRARLERAKTLFRDSVPHENPPGGEELFVAQARALQRPAPPAARGFSPLLAWGAAAAVCAVVGLWWVFGGPALPSSPEGSAPDPASLTAAASEPETPTNRSPRQAVNRTLRPPAIPSGAERVHRPNERIVTSDRQAETLVHADIGEFHVEPGSIVRLLDWSERRVRLHLGGGRIMANVTKRPPNTPVEIRTPYAVVRVVGTSFEVLHSEGSHTDVSVVEGIVDVYTPDNSRLGRLLAGDALRVEAPRAVREEQTTESQPGAALEASRRERRAPLAAFVRRARPARVSSRLPKAQREPERRAPAPAEAQAEATAEPRAENLAEPPTPRVPTLSERLDEARAKLEAGDDAGALRALDAAPSAQRGANAEWHALRGTALLLLNRPREAAKSYEAAALRSKSGARFRVDAARAYGRAGDTDSAIRTWMSLVEGPATGRERPRALMELSKLETKRGQLGLADKHLQEILDAHPRSPEASPALATLGRRRLDAGRLPEARALFTAHRNAARRSLAETALVGLLRVAVESRDLSSAQRLLGQYKARFPKGARRSEVEHLSAGIPLDEPPAQP